MSVKLGMELRRLVLRDGAPLQRLVLAEGLSPQEADELARLWALYPRDE